MTTSSVPATRPANPAFAFRQAASKIAGDLLSQWVGEERAREAAGRIAAAVAASASCAKKPEDFYSCTPQSVASCIAISALTGIMPGVGSTALAYLIPRSARKGEQKQLQYQLSHRGLAALARRSGQAIVAIPVSFGDKIDINGDGDVHFVDRDIDNPPTTWEDLKGVAVVVRELSTGLVTSRGWVAKKLIAERRAASDSYDYAEKKGNEWAKDSDPWHVWPVEMAMKTAMHYAISRGWAVIDDTEAARAIAATDDAPQSLPLVTGSAPSLPNEHAPAGSKSDRLAEMLASPAAGDNLPATGDAQSPEPAPAAAPTPAIDAGAGEAEVAEEVARLQEIAKLAKLAEGYGCSPDRSGEFAQRAYFEHADKPVEFLAGKPWAAKQKK